MPCRYLIQPQEEEAFPSKSRGFGFTAIANDLNPVAALILKATVEWPVRYGSALIEEFSQLSRDFICRAKPKYERVSLWNLKAFALKATSGRARSPVPIAMVLCRYRPIGVLLPMEPGSGSSLSSLPGPAHKVVSARSRSSNRPRSNQAPRWRKATAPAPYSDCGARD